MVTYKEKYAKYYAYAKLFKNFKERMGDVITHRHSVSTYLSALNECYHNMQWEFCQQSYDNTESLDVIAEIREQNEFNSIALESLDELYSMLVIEFNKLDRPARNTVMRIFSKFVDFAREGLLQI